MRKSQPDDDLRKASASKRVLLGKVTEARNSSVCAKNDKPLGTAGVLEMRM